MIGYQFQKMNHKTLVTAFEKTDEIILSVAEYKSVPVINLSKMMTGALGYFNDHVHQSEEGSRHLAKIVAAELNVLIKEK